MELSEKRATTLSGNDIQLMTGYQFKWQAISDSDGMLFMVSDNTYDGINMYYYPQTSTFSAAGGDNIYIRMRCFSTKEAEHFVTAILVAYNRQIAPLYRTSDIDEVVTTF